MFTTAGNWAVNTTGCTCAILFQNEMGLLNEPSRYCRFLQGMRELIVRRRLVRGFWGWGGVWGGCVCVCVVCVCRDVILYPFG
jgi:hypothetical protein